MARANKLATRLRTSVKLSAKNYANNSLMGLSMLERLLTVNALNINAFMMALLSMAPNALKPAKKKLDWGSSKQPNNGP